MSYLRVPAFTPPKELIGFGSSGMAGHPVTQGIAGHKIGLANLERVRAYFTQHLCATNRECGAALGLTPYAVGRHVKTIRAEWTRP